MTDNVISGAHLGAAVQAQNIHGGIDLHHPAGAPERPIPRQLPPVPASFIDREEALATVRQMCGTGAPFAVEAVDIYGPAGIGKTTLASVVVRELGEERFPDGYLYADLCHTGDRPAHVAHVLRIWLRALGLGPELPPTMEELTALWRSATATRRLASVVDNAEPGHVRDHLRLLLPSGAGSLLVATSRLPLYDLIAEGALLYELGPLPHDAARELLARFTAQHPPDASHLVALSAGSPLALTVLGPLAADLPLRSAVPSSSLTDNPLETAVAISLDRAHSGLPDAARSLYHRLGLLPGPTYDTAMVAAACALEEQQTARLLEELHNSSLLERIGPGRYRFHDLVRLHAAQHGRRDMSPQAEAEVRRRLVDWCLAWTCAAEALLTPSHVGMPRDYLYQPVAPAPFTTVTDALKWLGAHQDALMATVRLASYAGWHAACWQLVDAMWPLFLRLRPYESWLEGHRTGLGG